MSAEPLVRKAMEAFDRDRTFEGQRDDWQRMADALVAVRPDLAAEALAPIAALAADAPVHDFGRGGCVCDGCQFQTKLRDVLAAAGIEIAAGEPRCAPCLAGRHGNCQAHTVSCWCSCSDGAADGGRLG
jgi:hypothetical protein